MLIGVITPTYLREAMLGRFVRRMRRQSYRNWNLVVVHDGPNSRCESLVRRAGSGDSRISYAQTEQRGNNYGVSPRLEGLRHLSRGVSPDYCVFWDDDGYYSRHALGRIAEAIERAGHPDLLLVPIRHGAKILPRPGTAPDQIEWGQLDTGCLVVRPGIALESFSHMLDNHVNKEPGFFYTQDSRFFFHVRDRMPGVRIAVASCRPIGVHDGLNLSVYLRSILGLPPLGLVPQLRGWARRGARRFGQGDSHAPVAIQHGGFARQNER